MLILEDAEQRFDGMIGNKRVCSFGDISISSFISAKPPRYYGEGEQSLQITIIAELIRSYSVYGKDTNKYDNVRIGMNSRLDTIQADVLLVK